MTELEQRVRGFAVRGLPEWHQSRRRVSYSGGCAERKRTAVGYSRWLLYINQSSPHSVSGRQYRRRGEGAGRFQLAVR